MTEWSSYSLTLQPLPASTKLEMVDSRLDHYYVGKKCRVRHLRKLRLHWCKHQSVETTNVRKYFIMKRCKRRAHLITWRELAGLLIIWEDSFLRSGLRIARNEIFLCWVIRFAQDYNWSIITFKNTGDCLHCWKAEVVTAPWSCTSWRSRSWSGPSVSGQS